MRRGRREGEGGGPYSVGAASQWWSNEQMMVYFKLMMIVNDGEMLNDGFLSEFLILSCVTSIHDMRDKQLGKASNNKSYCVSEVSQGKRQIKKKFT